MEIVEAGTEALISRAKELVLEYSHSLEFDLGFQDFDAELENFPGSIHHRPGV